jgi:cbb3-type cytochrome oxidase maturation protein
MTILYLILPLALVFAAAAVAAFAWTVRSGQLDDVDTPPRRILFEDERADRISDEAAARTAGPGGQPRSRTSSSSSVATSSATFTGLVR